LTAERYIFVGTAVTRPEAIGGLFRTRTSAEGEWQLLDNGILTDTGVQAITVHPDDANLIFVGTRNSLYRSDNAGDSFTKLDVPLDKRQIWSVHIHPTLPKTIVLGTSPVAFFRSDDLGETWRQLALDHPERFPETPVRARAMRITIDPKNPNNWFAATEINGVLGSTDGGESWTDVSADLIQLSRDNAALKNTELTKDDREGMLDGHAMTFSTARPGVVYYSCRMGLFTSADNGAHWTDLKIGRFSPITYSRDILVDPKTPKTLYTCLSINSRSNQGALWRSNDLGENWTRVGPPENAPSTVMGMGIHRHDGGRVFAVTRAGQVYSTRDGGETWLTQQLPSHAGDAFCVSGN
jgi:photosystem II stability/assembly factor-like uncharacterized protein